MTSNRHQHQHLSGRSVAAVAIAFLCVDGTPAWAQIAPDQVREIRASIENRIEALAILGGDFGFSDGHLRLSGQPFSGERTDERLSSTKFGGAGDIGDPLPLAGGRIGWQGRLQGDIGHLKWTDDLHSSLLSGDRSEFTATAIEFGGGVRFWFSDSLSVAPTFMGMYGHASNGYSPRSAFVQANFNQLRELGLIDWHVDVWSLRPAVNVQYLARFNRSFVTLSSDLVYFHTEGFNSSNTHVRVGGNSGFVTNKVDVDVPLGIEIDGHELRTGGYLSRTDLSGGLKSGLGVQHLNEVHGRIVLDVFQQAWKFRWIGLGTSYLWGRDVHGWAAGIDVAFRF